MDRETALAWIQRWDTQQQVHLPDREDRFTVMIDAVEATAARPDPLILDLGAGPGSLGTRLLGRIPGATVIGIEADPVLLTLGTTAYQDRPGLRFAEADLREPGWPGTLGLERPADAAVSTTALHWLLPPELAALYAELARLLRPGGLLLNGDHLLRAEGSPVLARLDKVLLEREEARRFPDGHGESWQGWWDAVAADPELAAHNAERVRRKIGAGHHHSPSALLATHVAALREAGFAEVGTLWQRGENQVLCGVTAG